MLTRPMALQMSDGPGHSPLELPVPRFTADYPEPTESVEISILDENPGIPARYDEVHI